MISIPTIKERYTAEMALVILVCQVSFQMQPHEAVEEFLAKTKIDWVLFQQIIDTHKIAPIIFGVLTKIPSTPSGFLTQLRAKTFTIATNNLKNVEELVRLHELLANNNIPNIPYKGVILSKLLFNDFISRETSDIDFLIDKQFFAQAHNLLTADGYKPRFYNADFEKQFLATSHEILYRKFNGESAIKIEIHWAPTGTMMSIPVQLTSLFNGTVPMQLLNKEVNIMSIENNLLVVLIHHGVNDVWRSLRHCIDVAIFIKKYANDIDWISFRARLVKYNLLHTTVIGFYLANRLFGIEIPDNLKSNETPPDFIFDNLLNYPALKKPKFNFDNLRQQLYLSDSLSYKAILLVNYFKVAVTPSLRDWESITLPKKMYPLYYILKPYRILFRKKNPTQP